MDPIKKGKGDDISTAPLSTYQTQILNTNSNINILNCFYIVNYKLVINLTNSTGNISISYGVGLFKT